MWNRRMHFRRRCRIHNYTKLHQIPLFSKKVRRHYSTGLFTIVILRRLSKFFFSWTTEEEMSNGICLCESTIMCMYSFSCKCQNVTFTRVNDCFGWFIRVWPRVENAVCAAALWSVPSDVYIKQTFDVRCILFFNFQLNRIFILNWMQFEFEMTIVEQFHYS